MLNDMGGATQRVQCSHLGKTLQLRDFLVIKHCANDVFPRDDADRTAD